jgi:hypothetical protein
MGAAGAVDDGATYRIPGMAPGGWPTSDSVAVPLGELAQPVKMKDERTAHVSVFIDLPRIEVALKLLKSKVF